MCRSKKFHVQVRASSIGKKLGCPKRTLQDNDSINLVCMSKFGGAVTHCFEDILVHRHTQGQTNENGWMDKALLFTVTPPPRWLGSCALRESYGPCLAIS